MTIVSVYLILWRRSRGELRDEATTTHLFSRESLFVVNNFIFIALFVAVFWGSFGAPIISELFMQTNITLGKDYFMRVTPPLFAALYILMGVAPISAWGKTSLSRLGRSLIVPVALTALTLVGFYFLGVTSPMGLLAYGIVTLAGWVAIYETFRGVQARRTLAQRGVRPENPIQSIITLYRRNPRRYGGYIVHLGITIIGLGVIGSTVYQQETQQTLAVGQSLNVGGYTMRYDRLDTNLVAEDGRQMDIAEVTVMRDGQELAHLRPRHDYFPTGSEGMNQSTIAGAYSTLENDFYVILVGWEPVNANAATFKVYINPLINLVWGGGIILIIGTILAVWPREILPERVRQASGLPGGMARKGA
jgi:cytochrome c-type biogenesis protein CcmF